MFTSATVKLTLSYLAIIMVLCAMFSTALYGFATNELQHNMTRQAERLNIIYPELNFNPALQPDTAYKKSSHRILLNLIYLNLAVLLAAGLASYGLARWTLQPIEAAHEQQKRFTADVSHELRTPLTALKMTTEVILLDTSASKAALKQALVSNLEDANKLDILITNLLRLTRLEASELQQNFTAVPVQEIIDQAMAGLNDFAKQKHITMAHESDERLMIMGDRTSLIQLLTILLDNALKYSPENSTISLTAAAQDNIVLLTVADNGPGIAATDLPHVFDRFYRADTARTTSEANGFGLGLSIARMICELHQGDIQLVSKGGKGTTAELRLPAAQA
jgi:signal transduction histidine kinase